MRNATTELHQLGQSLWLDNITRSLLQSGTLARYIRYEQLSIEGVKVRVVSMPSWDLPERQGEAYRERVLPEDLTARVSVESAAALGWERYVGRRGAIITMRSFGLSAPGKVVQAHFGLDAAHVLAAARQQLARHHMGKKP